MNDMTVDKSSSLSELNNSMVLCSHRCRILDAELVGISTFTDSGTNTAQKINSGDANVQVEHSEP